MNSAIKEAQRFVEIIIDRSVTTEQTIYRLTHGQTILFTTEDLEYVHLAEKIMWLLEDFIDDGDDAIASEHIIACLNTLLELISIAAFYSDEYTEQLNSTEHRELVNALDKAWLLLNYCRPQVPDYTPVEEREKLTYRADLNPAVLAHSQGYFVLDTTNIKQ